MAFIKNDDGSVVVQINGADLEKSAKSFIDRLHLATYESLGDAAQPSEEKQHPIVAPLNETFKALKEAIPRDISLEDFIARTKQREIKGEDSFLTHVDTAIAACDTQAEKYDVDTSAIKASLTALKKAFVEAVHGYDIDRVAAVEDVAVTKPAIETSANVAPKSDAPPISDRAFLEASAGIIQRAVPHADGIELVAVEEPALTPTAQAAHRLVMGATSIEDPLVITAAKYAGVTGHR